MRKLQYWSKGYLLFGNLSSLYSCFNLQFDILHVKFIRREGDMCIFCTQSHYELQTKIV